MYLPPTYRKILSVAQLDNTKQQEAQGMADAMKNALQVLDKLEEQENARFATQRVETAKLEDLARSSNESNDKATSELISETFAKLKEGHSKKHAARLATLAHLRREVVKADEQGWN